MLWLRLCNFRGKLGYFYSNIWSHCLYDKMNDPLPIVIVLISFRKDAPNLLKFIFGFQCLQIQTFKVKQTLTQWALGTHWNIFLLLFVVYSSVFALSLSTVLTLVFSLSLLFSPYRSQSINISIAFISFLF